MNEAYTDTWRCKFDSFSAPSMYTVGDEAGNEIEPVFVNQLEIRAIQSLIGRDPDFIAAIGRLVAHIFQDGTVFYRGPNHVMNDSASRRLQTIFQDHAYHMLVDKTLFGMTLYTIEPDDKVGGLPRHIPLDQAYVGFTTDEYANQVYHVWFGGQPRPDIKVMVSHAPHCNGRINTAMATLLEIKKMGVIFDRVLLRSAVSRLSPVAVIQPRTAANPVALPTETTDRITEVLGGTPAELLLMSGGQTSRIIRSRAQTDPFLETRRSHGTVTGYDDNLRQVLADAEVGDTPRVVPVDGSDRVFISAGDGQEVRPLPPALPPQYYPIVEDRMQNYIAKVLGYPKELWAGTASTYKKDLTAIGQLADRTARFHAQDIEVKFNRFSEEIWHLRDDAVGEGTAADEVTDNMTAKITSRVVTEKAAKQRHVDKKKTKKKKDPPLPPPSQAPPVKRKKRKQAADPDADPAGDPPEMETDTVETQAEPAPLLGQLPVTGLTVEEVEPFLLSAYSYRDLNVRVKIGFVVRKEVQERASLASAFGIRQALPWMDTGSPPAAQRGDRVGSGRRKGRGSTDPLDNMFCEAPRQGGARGVTGDTVSAKLYLLDDGSGGKTKNGKSRPKPLNPAKQRRRIAADPEDDDDAGGQEDEEESNAGDVDNSQLGASD